MSELQTIDSPKSNLPQLADQADFDKNDLANLVDFVYLTQIQKIVLKTMIEGMTSDLVRTDTEIAEKAQVHVNTVRNCRNNAHFLACLSQYTKNLTKSRVSLYINALEKSALKGSVKAADLLIRYTGDFIPTSRNENLNATIKTGTQSVSVSDSISDVVARLCDLGYSIQRIHESIDEAYTKLKAENRVI